MNLREIGALSGYLGATLGAAMVIPQIVQVLRNRHVAGVSSLSWSLTGLACFTWLLYGVRTGEVPQIAGNVVIVSGAVAIATMVPSVTSVGVRVRRLTAAMFVTAVVAVLASPTMLGLTAFGIAVGSSWPQVFASFRRVVTEPSAVSVGAWVLRCASQAAWLLYALVIEDVPVTISACTLLASGALVLAFERWRGHADIHQAALATC